MISSIRHCQAALAVEGLESHADLEKAIKAIESAIKRSNKGNGEADDEASFSAHSCRIVAFVLTTIFVAGG